MAGIRPFFLEKAEVLWQCSVVVARLIGPRSNSRHFNTLKNNQCSHKSISDHDQCHFPQLRRVGVKITGISIASEERLMILCGQIHVIVRQGLFLRRFLEPHVLGTTKQVQRVPPNFAFRHRLTWNHLKVTMGCGHCCFPDTHLQKEKNQDPWEKYLINKTQNFEFQRDLRKTDLKFPTQTETKLKKTK